jgi:hypothetical protein
LRIQKVMSPLRRNFPVKSPAIPHRLHTACGAGAGRPGRYVEPGRPCRSDMKPGPHAGGAHNTYAIGSHAIPSFFVAVQNASAFSCPESMKKITQGQPAVRQRRFLDASDVLPMQARVIACPFAFGITLRRAIADDSRRIVHPAPKERSGLKRPFRVGLSRRLCRTQPLPAVTDAGRASVPMLSFPGTLSSYHAQGIVNPYFFGMSACNRAFPVHGGPAAAQKKPRQADRVRAQGIIRRR